MLKYFPFLGYNINRAYRIRRNKMTITITWQGALLTAIAVLGIILLIYLIVLISNLIKTVKNANKVLEDAQVISAIAADKAKKIDGIVDGISDTVSTVVDTVNGNKNIISAATNVVNAAAGLAGMVNRSEKKKEKEDE